MTDSTTPPVSAEKALTRLQQGNARFVEGKASRLESAMRNPGSGTIAHEQQQPFAIVLGCSDSRVPVEIVFDQSVGDLFVIRVAGNIVAPSQIASIEFAAATFGTQLVVVLGHSLCGAVTATLDYLQQPNPSTIGKLDSIVHRIRPAVEPLLAQHPAGSDELKEAAVRKNVQASVQQLCEGSDILSKLISEKKLQIVGAEYSLENGVVTLLD